MSERHRPRRSAGRRPARSRWLRRLCGERGAAAVEFALVLPVLLVLLVGIVEVSKVFNAQAALSAAAREGARVMALENSTALATSAVRSSADPLAVPAGAVSVSPSSCTGASSTATVTVTVRYRQPFAAGFLGGTGVDLTGRAVMRCGG